MISKINLSNFSTSFLLTSLFSSIEIIKASKDLSKETEKTDSFIIELGNEINSQSDTQRKLMDSIREVQVLLKQSNVSINTVIHKKLDDMIKERF